MDRHDYSLNNISAILSDISAIKSESENTVLSIEDMPYDWDTGIRKTVIEWFEILEIRTAKHNLSSFFSTGNICFAGAVSNIEDTDNSAGKNIESVTEKINNISEGFDMLLSYIEEVVPAPKFK